MQWSWIRRCWDSKRWQSPNRLGGHIPDRAQSINRDEKEVTVGFGLRVNHHARPEAREANQKSAKEYDLDGLPDYPFWWQGRFMYDSRVDATNPSTTRVFEARGITKVYHMGEVDVHALRGIDLDLFESEFVVLLGPSGSGKSTLVNILGGLDVPTAGTVRYRDRFLTEYDDTLLTRYRREHVGFVFQFYNLIASLTARENVALVTEIAENPMSPEDALRLVGLAERMDHFPSQLSGGEQQRVAIARSIAKRPEVLLCDEPTGALDVETGVVVLDAIQRVNRELGTTICVITHNAVIAQMATRVIHLSDGRITSVNTVVQRVSPQELRW
jgi:putative ABC transport system ATP-binding protein